MYKGASDKEEMFNHIVVISSIDDSDVEVVLMCAVANTFEEKMIGLRKVRFMNELEGMVFNFDKEERLSFHTMGMNFPIDIIFIGSDGRIKSIVKNVPPGTKEIIGEGCAVLEVNGGFCDIHKIEEGDLVFYDDVGVHEIAPHEHNRAKQRGIVKDEHLKKEADAAGLGMSTGDILENDSFMTYDHTFKDNKETEKRRKKWLERVWINHYTFDPDSTMPEPGMENP